MPHGLDSDAGECRHPADRQTAVSSTATIQVQDLVDDVVNAVSFMKSA